MSQTTSSAEPLKLVRYSDTLVLVDDALGAEANRLRAALEHFEATCREPAFRLRVSHVADSLVQYAQQARGIDLWVRDVGVGFQLADGGGMYTPVAGIDACLLPVTNGTQTGSIPQKILEAARQWLLEHADEFPNPDELKKALIAYLESLFDTEEERQAIGNIRSAIKETKETWDLVELIGYIGLSGVILHPVRGNDWIGEVTIHGSEDFLDSLGWSRKLRNMQFPTTGGVWSYFKDADLQKYAKQSGAHAFKESFGLINIAFAAIDEAPDNWKQYHDDGMVKVGCGLAVDTTMKVACGAAGAGLGAWAGGAAGGALLGAMSGGLLAPVGVAIGSKVGGYFGAKGGEWVADQIQERTEIDEWATDGLNAGVEWVGNEAGDALSDASEAAGEALSDASAATGAALDSAASAIDNALSSAVTNVAGWF